MIRTTAKTFALAVLAAGALTLQSGAAQAQTRPVGCTGPNNTLQQPATPGATDLLINKLCKVGAGTYKWRNVNIVEGGVLDFQDAAIDFWAANILVENGGTLSAGTPDTPIANNTVTIHLWGADANKAGTLPDAQGVGITCLTPALPPDPSTPTLPSSPCGIPNALWNANDMAHGSSPPMMMPKPIDQVKTVAQVLATLPDPKPVYPPGRTDDYFYAYHPLTFDGGVDPLTKNFGFFGYKVIGVSYGGNLKLFGKKGATYAKLDQGCTAPPSTSGSSWARLANPVAVNDKSLNVDRTVTLKQGDKIVVSSTDYMPGHSEEMTVAADVACGTTINVVEKFKYQHNGTRYPLTAIPDTLGIDAQLRASGAETRAAVGILSRSIRIVSEGDTANDAFPAEPPPGSTAAGYYFGGHVVARQGFQTFQVQGVEFYQLGQGGKIGHYPVHFHHARRVTAGTFVSDSSIHDSMTRWIVLHGTQDVALARNVGYKSIGHGYYLEDGTEINNALTANLGVFARAAIDNVQNPRKVPGILAAPNLHATIGDNMPYRSDYNHPTVFWIMNAYNEFTDNMAVGAGTCGVCYWMLPAANSTMSREMKWSGYASIQTGVDRAGMAPLKSFVGNSCSGAMTSFQTITATEACQGVGPGDMASPHPLNVMPVKNALAPASEPPPNSDAPTVTKYTEAAADYYPTLGDGGHFPTQCTADDCSVTPVRCGAGNLQNCMVTVLDHYTTSFNFAPFNFAAIWLRPQWYLVTDSVITDSQQAGLTMVTGGGYSESDVVPGHWALVRKSVFIGNTQDCPTCAIKSNPYASNGGPFNPSGAKCAIDANFNRPGAYCLNIDEGVSHQVSNFGMYQRLFSVYDGPAFQDTNAYLNITPRKIDDCTPFLDTANKVGRCDPPDLSPGNRRQSNWLAGIVQGLPKETPGQGSQYCYMPNAAIGWKQPNGFYYPPAFHSLNLFFNVDVEYRHFVISPLFKEGTYTTDTDKVSGAYCIWDRSLFTGFAGNDRQTVLNDDDGSLTGFKATTVINLDEFFAAPIDAYQCQSDETSRTSPYEYVTAVIYPQCVYDSTCARPPASKGDPDYPNPRWNDGDWNRACTNENCYGIPMWRQDAMPLADKGVAKSIRMMGQETGQRSTLTANNGTYYFDTTVDKAQQLTQDCTSTDPGNPCVVNVFQKNQSYYLFAIFAKEDTKQTYRFYVGDNTDFDPGSIHLVQAPIGKNPILFKDLGAMPAGRARWYTGNKATSNGVVEVDLQMSDLPELSTKFSTAEKNKCGPATYCHWDTTGKVPACVDQNGSADVCRWAVADLDCPDGGCVGFKFTLPDGFATRPATDPRPNPRPAAACIPSTNQLWNTPFQPRQSGVCPKPADTFPPDFCT
jgi:hypothetical protein